MSTKIKKRRKTAALSVAPNKLRALQLVYEGNRLLAEGAREKAESAWREAVQTDPECAIAWTFLTDYLAVSKRKAEAALALERLIAVSERTADNLFIFADKACFLNDYAMARQLLNEALVSNASPQTLSEVRLLLLKLDFTESRWIAAIEGASRILELEPANLDALSIRQRCYYDLGWSAEDVSDCRRYLEIKPEADRHSRLLVKLNYLAETTPESLYEESRKWNDLYAAPLAAQILPHTNNPDPERRLKIGYLSTDIRPNHPMLKLLPGVFEHHNRSKFEIFLYAIDAKGEAAVEVQKMVDHFVALPASRDAIEKRVRLDGIDILIDLPHRTMDAAAYLVFALKPAPIQCSWMGVLATTGLSTMDYFIGDQWLPCPGTEHLFSEKVYRLPRIHSCYRAFADPGIVTPPYFRNGHITFGSFNDPRKVTRDLVKVWSVILHVHPASKLLLKYTFLNFENGQRRFRQWFAEDGIAADRLIFEGLSPAFEYYAAWNKIDIHLDSFPYNGGTTTLDALWMGVPVISMGGRTTVASCAACILPEVGLPVASTFEQYVALAVQWANTVPQMPHMRRQLRHKMQASSIMDEPGLVTVLEEAYRQMWRSWCATQS